LWQTYLSIKRVVSTKLNEEDYYGALTSLSALRKPVDDFFNEVEIMTKESGQLRENRLGIIQTLHSLFVQVADLSKFSI
jgi:glycyl-tRNA synthetase beta chain